MGQKGSKEWIEGDLESTLVEALVVDQTAKVDDAGSGNSRKSASKKKKAGVKPQKETDCSVPEDNSPVPKVQSFFTPEISENIEEKSKKKTKKKVEPKRQAPKRRRSTRVAPCASSSVDADVTAEDGSSAQAAVGGPYLAEAIKIVPTEQVCLEVVDETNDSMESETESLAIKSPSDSESLKGDDSGATKVTTGGARNKGLCKISQIQKMRAQPEETLDDTFMTPLQLFNFMNDGQLSPYLFDPSYLLIIDIREAGIYKDGHIVTAYHVSDLEIPGKLFDLEEYTIILIYDSNGLTYSLTDSAMSTLMSELTNRKLDPSILEGGYNEFSKIYPFLCTEKIINSGRERSTILIQYPSEILPQQLYMGRGEQATDETVVNDLGITHIVNISTEHEDKFCDKLNYLTLKLSDESSTNLYKKFQVIIKFIGDAAISGGKILVHCNLGQSRSATAVIAYLMATKGWNLKDAFFYVKERRPTVAPNRGFFQQLSKFEEEVVGECVSDPHELWMR